jgi:flagellar M-ring protein FliF
MSRVTENIAYQSSRTVKHTRLPAGLLRKISLAVLVDQEVTWQPDKRGFQRVLTPPTPEKLKVIRDLVAGVTGFNAERGDQLVIETLPFESTLQLEPPAAPGGPGPAKPPGGNRAPSPLDPRILMIAGGALAVVVALALAAVRRARRKRPSAAVSVPPTLPPPARPGPPEPVAGGDFEEQIESQLAEREAMQKKVEAQALNSLKLTPVITKTAEVLAKHLREKVKQEPDVSAQILRTWIREEEG